MAKTIFPACLHWRNARRESPWTFCDYPAAASHHAAKPPVSRRKAWILAAAALILLAWGAHWLYQRSIHVYLDDARIDGEVVTLSSRVSGWITELPVIEGDEVKKGQLLVRVDERDSVLQREVLASKLQGIEAQMAVMRAQTGQVDQETLGRFQSETNRLAAAEAEAASLDAQLKQAEADYKRMQNLEKFVTGQEVDHARTAFQQAQERHRKAVSEVAAVRGQLSSAGGSRRQLGVLG
jgi:membrane fusion protein, multidrug efflux system